MLSSIKIKIFSSWRVINTTNKKINTYHGKHWKIEVEESREKSGKNTIYYILQMWMQLLKFSPHLEHIFSRRFSIKGKMPDYSSDCFLVGAFSLKEKKPDYYSG